MLNPPITPLLYGPGIEKQEPDEAETALALVETMHSILATTSKDYGHAVRSVHAKSHGLLQGELRVLGGLPAALAQGLFAAPATYPVVMRLSTNPGDILDDSVSAPRGLAVKVMGVEGERLPGAQGQATQDFVMATGPAFAAANAKAFLKNLKMLAATTDTPQVFKKALSATLRGIESAVEAVGGESVTLKSLGGYPLTHVLGETFHSQVPILYGPYIAKIQVAPVSPGLMALTDKPVDVGGRPNAHREMISEFFATQGGEWEFRVQLCTDLETMPVEDASVPWPEKESPYIAVARISAAPQPSWSEARSVAVDDGLAFSPWHGLAAHRPLGSIMRCRKAAYEMSSQFRATFNNKDVKEPAAFEGLPS